MNAIHWLRTKQEESELIFWLSIVSYDKDDRSFNNRAYFIYLILFFSIWLFAMLTFLAQSGAAVLNIINVKDPVSAATFLEILILGIWNLLALRQSLKRSPISFSEQDAEWLCSMPVDRRAVVMRWFILPWLKSALLIWLSTIVIGFSVAEVAMAGSHGASSMAGYIGYGLRAWIDVIPVQLTLFSAQWILGVLRLQKDVERRWLRLPVMIFSSLVLFLFLTYAAGHGPDLGFNALALVQAGFGGNNLFLSMIVNWSLAIFLIGMLYWVSGSFNLARAAQETKGIGTLEKMSQFGLTSYTDELKVRHRLGVSHAPSRIPKLKGDGALIWKELIQISRSLDFASIFNWIAILILPIAMIFIPDLGSRVFSIAFWSIQLGKLSVKRLRNDLACWQLTKQLPVSHKSLIVLDLSPGYLAAFFLCTVGFIIVAFITKSTNMGSLLLIPGIVAGVVGMAAFDVIRRSKSSYLLNGFAPQISAVGYVMGMLTAVIPVILQSVLSGFLNLILPFVTSLILGYLSFIIAIHSYKNIDKPQET